MIESVNFRTCNPDDFCPALKRYLQEDICKGLVVHEMGDMSDPGWRGEAVAYHTSSRHNGIMINFCPFCGTRLFIHPEEVVAWLPPILQPPANALEATS